MKKPSIFKRAFNFLNAIFNHAKDGFKKVPKAKQEERLNICKSCVEYYDKEKNECNHCGCLLSLKTQWKNMECPIGKW
jgi:hypothetical protein